jgi:hypothetical protein
MTKRVVEITWLLTLLTAGPLLAAQAKAANPRFSLTITTPNETVVAGSELRVKVVLTNASDETISVEKAPGNALGHFYYDVDVRDSRDEVAPDTDDGKKIRKKQFTILTEVKFAVPPGQSVEDAVLVTRLYRLRPGKYTVQFQRWDYKSKLIVKSNKISITVTE